ncbi:MAG: hypothetical protein ABJC79_06510, partial [Acidimicrobiia bacterium]
TPGDVRAIILARAQPTIRLGAPPDFAARGAHELVLHTHDLSAGLGIEFVPPEPACARLRDHTAPWPFGPDLPPTDDAWSDMLERSGRERVTPRP